MKSIKKNNIHNLNGYIFLLPLFNDWDSCKILLNKINDKIKKLHEKAEVVIVNDNSNINKPKFKFFSNIDKIKILNLNTNVGSQKAISIGLKFLKNKIKKNKIITILDSDGEDDVNKIPEMIKAAKINHSKVIVSSRTKRQENFLFKILYFFHKLLTFLFTLKWISFGNFSSFNSVQLKKILSNNSSWLAFSACVAKNCEIKKKFAERKKRFIGTSKLSILGLINHSLRVNCVFFSRVFLISSLYILILLYFVGFGIEMLNYIIYLIIFYNFTLGLVIYFNNQKKYKVSLSYIKNK